MKHEETFRFSLKKILFQGGGASARYGLVRKYFYAFP